LRIERCWRGAELENCQEGDNEINAVREENRDAINLEDLAGANFTLVSINLGEDSNADVVQMLGSDIRNDQFTVDYSKKYILNACDQSLERLKRETIDYYQLHSARVDHLEKGECIEAMQELQKEGKIRYWGLSLNTFDPLPETDLLMPRNLGNGFQLVLNILNQKALPVIREANKNGYGVIARMPGMRAIGAGRSKGSRIWQRRPAPDEPALDRSSSVESANAVASSTTHRSPRTETRSPAVTRTADDWQRACRYVSGLVDLRMAIVAPRCDAASSKNSTTSGWRSSTCCTMPRCTPWPRP